MKLTRFWSGVCFAATFASLPAEAVTLRLGQSYIEQGDFILHPGLSTQADWGEARVRFDFSGRRFGPFTEATGILSYDRSFKLFPWPQVFTHYGLSLMDEYTAFDSKRGKDDSIHAMNFGINVGLGVELLRYDAWDVRMEWNSHLFAAGLAFIFLTTARKSVFTLAAGYEL